MKKKYLYAIQEIIYIFQEIMELILQIDSDISQFWLSNHELERETA